MDKNQLEEARVKLCLTKTKTARLLNTPRSTYVKWERGESRVPGIVEVAFEEVKRIVAKDRWGSKC